MSDFKRRQGDNRKKKKVNHKKSTPADVKNRKKKDKNLRGKLKNYMEDPGFLIGEDEEVFEDDWDDNETD